MAVGPKIAGFAALTRVLFTAFPAMASEWSTIAIGIPACTMVIGNFAVLNSALSLYYYLKPVIYCYMKPQTTDIQPAMMLASLAFIMAISGVLILYLGVAPAQLYRTIETSLASLHQLILAM